MIKWRGDLENIPVTAADPEADDNILFLVNWHGKPRVAFKSGASGYIYCANTLKNLQRIELWAPMPEITYEISVEDIEKHTVETLMNLLISERKSNKILKRELEHIERNNKNIDDILKKNLCSSLVSRLRHTSGRRVLVMALVDTFGMGVTAAMSYVDEYVKENRPDGWS